VQPLQRSTRRFALTEAGNQLVRRCTAMLAELESRVAELSELRAHPEGCTSFANMYEAYDAWPASLKAQADPA
jgi:DNA-binding transcriptional LysR family regulator